MKGVKSILVEFNENTKFFNKILVYTYISSLKTLLLSDSSTEIILREGPIWVHPDDHLGPFT